MMIYMEIRETLQINYLIRRFSMLAKTRLFQNQYKCPNSSNNQLKTLRRLQLTAAAKAVGYLGMNLTNRYKSFIKESQSVTEGREEIRILLMCRTTQFYKDVAAPKI